MSENSIDLFLRFKASFSFSSHAIHAYRSSNCENATHTLEYKGNYLVGGSYELKDKTSQKSIEIFEADGEQDDAFQLEFLEGSVISKSEIPAVCTKDSEGYEFESSESTSMQAFKVLRLSSDQEKSIGVKSGSEVEMKCIQRLDIPVKCN